MNTLICAGGSGLRVLEAVLHLCAAGLGPRSIRVLGVDPDGSNGGTTRLKGLIETYQKCHDALSGDLGQGLHLFGTELDLLDTEDERGLKLWTPVQPKQTLRELLNYDNLSATETPPELVDLFFTETELNMNLDQGFRGNTAIGAAAMSLLPLWAEKQPWKQLCEKLRSDLQAPEGSRVMVLASVFGGTGASAIHPIVNFLRTVPETNADRLRIGVASLVPYFRFEASAAEGGPWTELPAAKAERFALATRSAAEYYDHLRKNQRWPFDGMDWVGDDTAVHVVYAPGGPLQKNPAHFVELLAALTSLDFLRTALPEGRSGNGPCRYAGPRQDIEPQLDSTLLEWPDVPLSAFSREEVRLALLRFFLLGMAHLGFGRELLERSELDGRPFCVPWYLERFASKGDSLLSVTDQSTLRVLSNYFATYHFTWWHQIHDLDIVRLFNRQAIRLPENVTDHSAEVDLTRLANALWPDRSDRTSLDSMDRFFTDMVLARKDRGGGKGAAAYLSLLARSAERFIDREYRVA